MNHTDQVASSPSPASTSGGNTHDVGYREFVSRIRQRFLRNVDGGARPLFTTDGGESLWRAYLDSFPVEQRQYHNCNACRRFMERFGALVTIDEQGLTTSALWDVEDADALHAPAVRAMLHVVQRSKVTGVFLASDREWGQALTGEWAHFSVTPPASMRFGGVTKTAGQAMAEKLQDFITVMRAIDDYAAPTVSQALSLVRAEALYRSEKILGPLNWLSELHAAIARARGRRAYLVWRAVATAPPGFCHPRSSMTGTLLDDLAVGMPFEDAKRRFAAKMKPEIYQRPQAAPTAGAIAQAEKLVSQLGIERSLPRRFCRLDEVQAVWKPRPPTATPAGAGVFSHLTPKGAAPARTVMATGPAMTWEKFARTVLPTADRMALYVPGGRHSFGALVTAVHADAPPILQWDLETARNPVSWYGYTGGSLASQWGLAVGTYADVDAVAFKPSMWGTDAEKHAHQGKGLMLILRDARETRTAGSALFPEFLKAELHGVRSVIEAYSKTAAIEGMAEDHVAGLILGGGGTWDDVRLRVTGSDGSVIDYKLDRWD